MKTKIICLVGASGSGKDTIARRLEDEGLTVDIQSYTTREPREPGEWGHTFIEELKHNESSFEVKIKKPEYKVYLIREITKEDMIAYFNSYKSGNHYFATDEQVVRGKINTYRVDPKGAEMVKEYYKDSDVEVITIFIQVDSRIRSDRLRRRLNESLYQSDRSLFSTEEYQTHVLDRLESDKEVFRVVPCDYTISNNGCIEETIEAIKKVII